MTHYFSSNDLILIIDHLPSRRHVSKTMIEEGGFSVIEATSDDEAYLVLSQEKPQAIVLSGELEGVDIALLCQSIKQHPDGKQIPIIIINGKTDEYSLNQAYDMGASDYMCAPTNWSLLSRRLRHLIKASKTEDEAHFLAYYDTLTHLPNRTLFREHLDYAIDRADRLSTSLVVLLIDIDNFKEINDTLGHLAGDALLCKVGEKLNQSMRSTDKIARHSPSTLQQIARFGGDEFTLLLQENTSPTEIIAVARRIIDEINKTMLIQEKNIQISVSIGISLYPTDANNSYKLLKTAERAMHQAKSSGKNRFAFYDKTMNSFAKEKMSLQHDLKKALDRNEFFLEFEPVYSTTSHTVIGFESLLRWNHPTKGPLLPSEFLSLAEESDLINEIGIWQIYEACSAAKVWHEEGFEQSVIVKLSTRQVNSKFLLPIIKQALIDTLLPPQALCLEISEAALLTSQTKSVALINALTQLGITLIIGNMGLQHTSLSFLCSIPANYIKIDSSFIQDIPSRGPGCLVIKALLALGHTLAIPVIASGVETKSEYELLKTEGCSLMQGYYLNQAIPLGQLLLFLSKHHS